MATVSADFAFRQKSFTFWRHVIRDVALRAVLIPLLARITVEGLEHIPSSGPAVIIFNHINAIDPIVIVGVVRNRFIVPMTKVENFGIPFFGGMIRRWGAYPVHRDKVDRRAVRNTLDLLLQEHLVLIAPEGTRNPALIKARNGAAYVASRTGAMIVPAAIDGTTTILDNLKRLRRTPIRLRFGRPFRFTRRGNVPRPLVPRMMDEAMYQLAALLPEHRRGHYSDLSRASTELIEFVNVPPDGQNRREYGGR